MKNTMALLNDFIGWSDSDDIPDDDDTRIIIALTEAKVPEGLKSVFEWTDEMEAAYTITSSTLERGPYAANADDWATVKNPLAVAIEMARDTAETHDIYVVVLWADEDQDCEMLLDLATTYEIPALDLTKGLDVLAFDGEEGAVEDQSPPWPVEPEAASASASEEPVALEPEEEPLTEEPHLEEAAEAAPSLGAYSTSSAVSSEDVMVYLNKVIMFFQAWTSTIEGQQGYARAIEAQKWLETLNRVIFSASERAHESQDVIEAMLNGGSAADVLRARKTNPAPESTETPTEAPEADSAPTRGRSRKDTAREYFDEETKSWVRLGRGRPPKGVELRTINTITGETID